MREDQPTLRRVVLRREDPHAHHGQIPHLKRLGLVVVARIRAGRGVKRLVQHEVGQWRVLVHRGGRVPRAGPLVEPHGRLGRVGPDVLVRGLIVRRDRNMPVRRLMGLAVQRHGEVQHEEGDLRLAGVVRGHGVLELQVVIGHPLLLRDGGRNAGTLERTHTLLEGAGRFEDRRYLGGVRRQGRIELPLVVHGHRAAADREGQCHCQERKRANLTRCSHRVPQLLRSHLRSPSEGVALAVPAWHGASPAEASALPGLSRLLRNATMMC